MGNTSKYGTLSCKQSVRLCGSMSKIWTNLLSVTSVDPRPSSSASISTDPTDPTDPTKAIQPSYLGDHPLSELMGSEHSMIRSQGVALEHDLETPLHMTVQVICDAESVMGVAKSDPSTGTNALLQFCR